MMDRVVPPVKHLLYCPQSSLVFFTAPYEKIFILLVFHGVPYLSFLDVYFHTKVLTYFNSSTYHDL